MLNFTVLFSQNTVNSFIVRCHVNMNQPMNGYAVAGDITYTIYQGLPRDDCARNMFGEKLTTRQGFICEKNCVFAHSLPIPKKNNLT